MKVVLLAALILSSSFAFAMRTPHQITRSTLVLALTAVSLDEMSQIISVKNESFNSVVIKYVNSKGICYDQLVPIVFDGLGAPSIPEVPLPPVTVCK